MKCFKSTTIELSIEDVKLAISDYVMRNSKYVCASEDVIIDTSVKTTCTGYGMGERDVQTVVVKYTIKV